MNDKKLLFKRWKSLILAIHEGIFTFCYHFDFDEQDKKIKI